MVDCRRYEWGEWGGAGSGVVGPSRRPGLQFDADPLFVDFANYGAMVPFPFPKYYADSHFSIAAVNN